MATRCLTEEQIRVFAPQVASMRLSETKVWTRAEIIAMLGISLFKLGTIERSEIYQNIFTTLAKKSKGLAENTLKGQTLLIRATLNEYTEKAVDVIYRVMMDEKAPKAVRVDAAKEILDRDGRFAKVSRLMNVRPGEDGAPMLPEDEANQILDALKAFGEQKKVQVQ